MEFGIRHKYNFPLTSDPAGRGKCSCYSALKMSTCWGGHTAGPPGAARLEEKLNDWNVCWEPNQKRVTAMYVNICLRPVCQMSTVDSEICAARWLTGICDWCCTSHRGGQKTNIWLTKSLLLFILATFLIVIAVFFVFFALHSQEMTSERTARKQHCRDFCNRFCW